MKECPQCSVCQDDTIDACPHDGTILAAGIPGDRVIDGRYRVDVRLGEGGMGRIYRVRHLALQRNFALKIIQPEQAADSMFLARFRVEVEALGRLKHPNIVDVSDYGVDPRQGGLPYLVMEHLEGESLASRLRREGALGVEAAMPILDGIARGVDFAHSNGVLHRDLKPANVFLCDGQATPGAVKVVDFGIARILGVDPPASTSAMTLPAGEPIPVQTSDSSPGLTQQGVVIGSIPYLSPEVLKEKPATPASDIYALGVLAYETLTGCLPFTGSLGEVLVAHVHDSPLPPSTVKPTLPTEFDRPLLQALDKVPSGRPKNASVFVAGLRSALQRAEFAHWRAKEIPRRAWLSVAAAVVLIAVSPFLWNLQSVETLERRTVDARFSWQPPRSPDPRILVVAIDDASLEADQTPLAEKADEFGTVVQLAFTRGAKAAAVDLLLPEGWSRSKAFSDLVLHEAPRLTLGVLWDPSGAVVGTECLNGLIGAALGPERASEIFGSVNLAEDPDGVVRQARLSYADRDGGRRATWASRAASTLVAQSPQAASGESSFWIDYSINSDRLARISWKDFPARLENDGGLLKDRLLLLGATFAGGGDDARAIPHRRGEKSEISGLVLQALIVNTLLENIPYREVRRLPAVLICGAVAGVLFFAVLSRERVGTSLVAGIGFVAVYVAAAWMLFGRTGWIVVIVGPILTLLIAGAGALVLRRILPRRPTLEVTHP